jgi:hypothetical protein
MKHLTNRQGLSTDKSQGLLVRQTRPLFYFSIHLSSNFSNGKYSGSPIVGLSHHHPE